jgi:opacity protein-like surface antigen
MNLNQYLLSAVLILGLPSVAVADAPQNYWGMGIDGVDFEGMTTDGRTLMGSAERDMNGFNLRYGFWLPFDLIGVEVRIGNIAEESGTMVGDPEVRYVFGMGKLNLPFERVNLYVLGGVSKVYYDFAGREQDDEDVVGGVGIELLGSETTGLTIEFLKYGVNDDDIEGEIITIGFNHRFELPGFR